jgi:predicted enzyme related to lactoylglutathione lyase
MKADGRSTGIIVYLFTDDLERDRAFYEAALGVKGEMGGPNWCAFHLHGGEGRGATFALHRQVEPPIAATKYHLDFRVDGIAQAVERFERAGGSVARGVQDEAFGKSALLRDPAGREFTLIESG